MAKKAFKVLFFILVVLGAAISIINFASAGVNAGQITKYGTYIVPGDEETCPGEARNCVTVWYVPDG